eukprot:9597530-Heterocapsa_arctica.AAC.1
MQHWTAAGAHCTRAAPSVAPRSDQTVAPRGAPEVAAFAGADSVPQGNLYAWGQRRYQAWAQKGSSTCWG